MMIRWFLIALVAGALPLFAQNDDFRRERNPKTAKAKDALEGKAPPKLVVGEWLNAKKAITLDALKGKVVVLDFWGVW